MRKMRTTILSVTALAMFILPFKASNADAKVRVNATLRTPTVRIHVGNDYANYKRGYKRRHRPTRTHMYVWITRQDRAIAHRLAWYTGVPSREFIQLKRQGYRWPEIGRWFYVSRPVVRAAMQRRTWRRFLHDEWRFAHRGFDPRERRRVAYVEHDDYCDY